MVPEGVSIRHADKLYIGGEWVDAKSGKMLEIVNPNTEEVVARTAEANEADMDRAVEAARKAFDHGPWPTTPPAERGRMVRELAERLKGMQVTVNCLHPGTIKTTIGTKPFCGTGTRNLTDAGKAAVAELFERSFEDAAS